MQLMPATAQGLGVQNSFDPNQAVDGAARCCATCSTASTAPTSRSRRTTPGPGAVLRYDGIPPYPETQNYVRSVMSMMESSSMTMTPSFRSRCPPAPARVPAPMGRRRRGVRPRRSRRW